MLMPGSHFDLNETDELLSVEGVDISAFRGEESGDEKGDKNK